MTCLETYRVVHADPRFIFRPWWGSSPAWLLPLESRARRRYGATMSRTEGRDSLVYEFDAIDVIARDPVSVRVEFHRNPSYELYGLHPMDYPRVFADVGAASPHRMPDDSLCLYYPRDPRDRRWVADDGLDELLNITARHLFAEDYWRSNDQVWPVEQAPHGIPEEAA